MVPIAVCTKFRHSSYRMFPIPPPPPVHAHMTRPMGAAAYGGKGFKERARVSGQRPVGSASCRQQCIQAPCPPPPLKQSP